MKNIKTLGQPRVTQSALCLQKKIFRIHESVNKNDGHKDVQIALLRYKIQKLQESKNISTDVQYAIDQLTVDLHNRISEVSQLNIEKDWKKQDHFLHKPDMFRFWRNSTNLMSKSAYTNQKGVQKTDAEKEKLADNIDKTFIQDYSANPLDFDKYLQIRPNRNVIVQVWPEFISQTIKDMTKIDSFYKNYSNHLSIPLSYLIEMIDISQYFPECLKISKCTMLPERAIFSLPTLSKIVETIFKKSIDNMKGDDGALQMAYTPARGTTLCNAITLWKVEINTEPSMQCLQDMVKAFNSVRIDTVVNEAQAKYGYGKLFKSMLTNRRYTFNGKTRGKNHNSGVMPGTIMGVEPL